MERTASSGLRKPLPRSFPGGQAGGSMWPQVAQATLIPLLTSRGMRPWYHAWLRRSVLLSFSSSSSSL